MKILKSLLLLTLFCFVGLNLSALSPKEITDSLKVINNMQMILNNEITLLDNVLKNNVTDEKINALTMQSTRQDIQNILGGDLAKKCTLVPDVKNIGQVPKKAD